MKTLTAFNDVLQADKIVKTETSIAGFIGGKEVFSFEGIRSFSGFSLAPGEEWDVPQEKEIDSLEARQKETENAVLLLMELQMMGGM